MGADAFLRFVGNELRDFYQEWNTDISGSKGAEVVESEYSELARSLSGQNSQRSDDGNDGRRTTGAHGLD